MTSGPPVPRLTRPPGHRSSTSECERLTGGDGATGLRSLHDCPVTNGDGDRGTIPIQKAHNPADSGCLSTMLTGTNGLAQIARSGRAPTVGSLRSAVRFVIPSTAKHLLAPSCRGTRDMALAQTRAWPVVPAADRGNGRHSCGFPPLTPICPPGRPPQGGSPASAIAA